MIEDFKLIFIDQYECESLMIQIEYQGQILCRIDKENGNDDMKIHFYPDFYVNNEDSNMKFSLNEFLKILDIAKNELSLCP
ncbi:hypothetical protein ACFPVS_13450 [Neisseria weixii]|uniref:Uncharacterized protein n=1 Tax=Neisseria weixii TaxID=1853276 RepID=A0A3N4MN36_9NEIS|nr:MULTISPECIES: hypothetical protein [Neisseria]ATD64840.1 hypothetical protein CGZ65_05110 [Neisseria weixii]RPD83076.1 hypothetical protein EGK74_13590 [Neisseria weixii]RPD83228.1 hypothetical protein EGK75_13605 [Neisseria weixii]